MRSQESSYGNRNLTRWLLVDVVPWQCSRLYPPISCPRVHGVESPCVRNEWIDKWDYQLISSLSGLSPLWAERAENRKSIWQRKERKVPRTGNIIQGTKTIFQIHPTKNQLLVGFWMLEKRHIETGNETDEDKLINPYFTHAIASVSTCASSRYHCP